MRHTKLTLPPLRPLPNYVSVRYVLATTQVACAGFHQQRAKNFFSILKCACLMLRLVGLPNAFAFALGDGSVGKKYLGISGISKIFQGYRIKLAKGTLQFKLTPLVVKDVLGPGPGDRFANFWQAAAP